MTLFRPPSTFAPLNYARLAPNRSRWLSQLTELIAFPTISALPQHRRDLQACAEWLARHLAEIGLQHVQILPGEKGGYPSVYGDWLHAPGKPTLLLYGHYDVQPVDPLSAWHTPPFCATIIRDHLFARGASDDKGQLFIHLKAIESYLRTQKALPLNIKIWLEGEEEIGSPHLPQFLRQHGKKLKADAVLVSDTEMLGKGRPAIIYGLRGHLNCELEVRGAKQDLHSGRYGGAILNPLQALSETIASFHNSQGRVAIPGFYQNVRSLNLSERQTLGGSCPEHHQQIIDDLGVPMAWGEPTYSFHERRTIRPALTINGLTGGYTGTGSKSVIPSRGIAKFSFRLVPDQEPMEIARLVQRQVATTIHPAVRAKLRFTGASRPVLLPRNSPVMAAAVRAVTQVWGKPPVFTRSGGTIALVEQLHRRWGIPIVLLGFGLPADNIHAPNEQMSLTNFFQGITTVIQLLAEYAR